MSVRLHRVLPSAQTIEPTTDDGRAALAAWYETGATARLNMVTTLTGAASGADGTSDTITSRVDRTILGTIRRQADVVLVGAQSVRAEGYVTPRASHLAILTRTGDLSGHRLEPAAGRRLLVLCPPDAARRVRAAVADAPVEVVTGSTEPLDVLARLASEGMPRVVCEGGPTIAGAFLAAGALDELCITVSPQVTPVGGPFLPVPATPATRVLSHAVDDDGFAYLRLAVR